jgi:hypothetical protein
MNDVMAPDPQLSLCLAASLDVSLGESETLR